VEGQKNRTVIGITTSVSSPSTIILVVISTSGVIDNICFLNSSESIDKNSLSTKLLIVCLSDLPSTEVIIFLSLVVNSPVCSFDNF